MLYWRVMKRELTVWRLGLGVSVWRSRLYIRISIVKIRRSRGCLIFIMGIPIPEKRSLYWNGVQTFVYCPRWQGPRRWSIVCAQTPRGHKEMTNFYGSNFNGKKLNFDVLTRRHLYRIPNCRHTHRSGTLLWRHNGRASVSNHQPHDCLLNCLFRRRSK